MNRFFSNALCAGLIALLFPLAGIAQLQMVDSKSLRALQPAPARHEISASERQRFHPFARSLPDESLSADAAKAAVLNAGNAGAIHLDNYSIEQATIIVMQLVAEDAEADLKAMLAEMDATRKQRSAARQGNAQMQHDRKQLAAETKTQMPASSVQASTTVPYQDGASRTSEAIAQRLKAQQDRRDKAMETLRKLMEASSSTESTVIGNIK